MAGNILGKIHGLTPTGTQTIVSPPRDDTDYSYLGWVQRLKQDFVLMGEVGTYSTNSTELQFSQETSLLLLV